MILDSLDRFRGHLGVHPLFAGVAAFLETTDLAALFARIEEGRDRGYLCALSFPVLYCLLSKSLRRDRAAKVLEKLRIVFRVASVDEKVIDLALTADFKDFEDAVHYYSAVQVQADCLVTRNKKDFPTGRMTILTPEEFLALPRG